MYFHLILTDDCDLCCSYCRAKAFDNLVESEGERAVQIDESLPDEMAYDPEILYRFLKLDPSPTLTFYGGEPLLRTDLVEQIVREAPVQRFMIQTNGLLLDRLPPDILGMMIFGWLAPMAFLSALALLLSLWIGTGNAIAITYILWVAQYIPYKIVVAWMDSPAWLSLTSVYQQFWQNSMLLLLLSIPLFVLALWSARRPAFRPSI